MSVIPGKRPVNRFTSSFRGSFGRFRTESSHTLHYLSTTLRINDIGKLSTAADTFDMREIGFDELIQRDIDHGRVSRIANDYLRAGTNRAVFFPPLLVCLAVLDDQGRLKTSYDEIDKTRRSTQDADDILSMTFDRDGFRLELVVSDAEHTDRTIEWDGQQVHFFDYAATLSVNPDRTKLVVLDGQHRLKALEMLINNPESRPIVASIEQPVCMVWMPQAAVAQGGHIVQDLRDIFVTVNSEPQRVSGHFILLLRDNSYAAATVRALANLWKSENDDSWSRLHLLEWNTREDQSTDQRLRPFSITTVSIIASALESYLFSTPKLAPMLLKLEERSEELQEADSELDFWGLRDSAKGINVDRIIKEQIDIHLVPAIAYLLRQLHPYQNIERALGRQFAQQAQAISRGNPAEESLRRYLNRFVYNSKEMFDDLAPGAWAAFKAAIEVPQEHRVFFLAVFQQGFLRFWLVLARILAEYNVSALDSARAAVAAAEAHTANKDSNYLRDDQPYTRRVLWKNDLVNYGPNWAKEAWTDIQLAPLLIKNVRDSLISVLPKDTLNESQIGFLEARLIEVGSASARRYTTKLEEEITRDIKKNLADFFGEVEAGVLRDLRVTDPAEYESRVGELSRIKFEEALDRLGNMLQKTAAEIKPAD
ncbi:DNA sulfur modification protein DndB [Pseudomonas sp. A-RE-26]|uniref:DNA sulfur modification protein DndB n=1 Tax=Pseudomonas sp. A-RE-26 TaxID=2832402 RepID=UPI001CBCB365|nr:DNA sulfur modification protein DndB [Pseudomonas sp. A-RE-26]